MKFHKEQHEFLHRGKNNAMHQYMLGAIQLESSLAEKDSGVLMDTKLNMSKKHALAAKKGKWHPGLQQDRCYKQDKVSDSSLLLSTDRATPGVLCLVLDSSAQERQVHTGETPMKPTKMTKGLEHFSYEERLRVVIVYSLEVKSWGRFYLCV